MTTAGMERQCGCGVSPKSYSKFYHSGAQLPIKFPGLSFPNRQRHGNGQHPPLKSVNRARTFNHRHVVEAEC